MSTDSARALPASYKHDVDLDEKAPSALQKLAKYKLLDADGLCAVGESIENGEIFINKVSPTNTKDMLPMGAGNSLPDNLYKPTPMSYKGAKGETSVVDKVLLTQNDEQEDIFKVTK